MTLNIQERGAVGDGKTLNTAIIQQAIDDCAASGSGRVVISGGLYMTGRLVMKSNVELHIESDGVLLGSPDCADYPETKDFKHVIPELLPRWRSSSLIFAEECENIAITGSGTIDCNGEYFVRKRPEGSTGWSYERIDAPTPPRVVFFTGCRNIKIEDVTMQNQPAGWSYWIHDCDFVTFDKVKIVADVNYPNNDGIHINCSRNVTISNCSITCGDDCIIVRANSVSLKENKVCERVTVTNCNLTSYSSAIRIGWINDGVIRNCTFSNLVMTDCSVGISVFLPHTKRNTGHTSSSDIGREATLIENLSFSNIIIDKSSSNPIKLFIHENPEVMCAGIRNIYFSGIHASGASLPMIVGREDCRLKNIVFYDSTFEQIDGSTIPNLTSHGASPLQPYGAMTVKHVDGLRFVNTDINVY